MKRGVLASVLVVIACISIVCIFMYERRDGDTAALPVINISTDNGERIASKYIYTDAKLRLNSGKNNQLNYLKQKIKIKGRGNSSWGMPKKNYSIKFVDSLPDLFGLGKGQKWSLIANYADKSLLRNWFAGYISNNILNNESEWNPSYIPVNLYINDEYMGVYTLADSISIEDSRINIQCINKTNYDVNNDGKIDLHDGGFVVEVNIRNDVEYTFESKNGVPFSISDPDISNWEQTFYSPDDMYNHIRTVVQNVEDTIYEKSWNEICEVIDVDSFISWYLVNEITKNCDACFGSSVYMYYNPADGKIHMGPNWDFDISSGNINYNNCDDFEGWWIRQGGWFVPLFQHSEFQELVKDTYNEKYEELFDAVNNGISEEAQRIKPAAEQNFETWPILGEYVWPNDDGYAERTTYEDEIHYLITWLNNRMSWMRSNM